MAAKTICISNLKGGVGKTTSAINIGYSLANQGYKVCLIDLDPQANLTISMGITSEHPSIYNFIVEKLEFQDVIQKLSNKVSILPSHLILIRADIALSTVFERERILDKKLLLVKKDFDFILIDCPPNLGIVTINGIVTSDFIFSPIEAEFLALQGFSILIDVLGDVGVEVDKIFVTKYDKRKILNRQVLESLEKSFPEKLFKTKIRNNVSLPESQSQGKDIFSYDNKSYGAEDYASLTAEILQYITKG